MLPQNIDDASHLNRSLLARPWCLHAAAGGNVDLEGPCSQALRATAKTWKNEKTRQNFSLTTSKYNTMSELI